MGERNTQGHANRLCYSSDLYMALACLQNKSWKLTDIEDHTHENTAVPRRTIRCILLQRMHVYIYRVIAAKNFSYWLSLHANNHAHISSS